MAVQEMVLSHYLLLLIVRDVTQIKLFSASHVSLGLILSQQ